MLCLWSVCHMLKTADSLVRVSKGLLLLSLCLSHWSTDNLLPWFSIKRTPTLLELSEQPDHQRLLQAHVRWAKKKKKKKDKKSSSQVMPVNSILAINSVLYKSWSKHGCNLPKMIKPSKNGKTCCLLMISCSRSLMNDTLSLFWNHHFQTIIFDKKDKSFWKSHLVRNFKENWKMICVYFKNIVLHLRLLKLSELIFVMVRQ